MTAREIEILAQAIKWAQKWQDCNPEVGPPGPSKELAALKVISNLSFKVNKEDIEKAIAMS
jgi:predicted  nucleic acid-binding Zn ribbon protein